MCCKAKNEVAETEPLLGMDLARVRRMIPAVFVQIAELRVLISPRVDQEIDLSMYLSVHLSVYLQIKVTSSEGLKGILRYPGKAVLNCRLLGILTNLSPKVDPCHLAS